MAACRVSCSKPDQGNWVTTLPGLSPIFPGGSLTTKHPLTVPRGASRIDPEVSPLSFSPLSQGGVWSGGAVLPATFATTPGVVTFRMPDVDSNIRLVWVIWKDNKFLIGNFSLLIFSLLTARNANKQSLCPQQNSQITLQTASNTLTESICVYSASWTASGLKFVDLEWITKLRTKFAKLRWKWH